MSWSVHLFVLYNIGFVYIARRLPRLVWPLALAYTGSKLWELVFENPLPCWLRVSAREAARRGAVLAPRVKSMWPGGLDTIISVSRAFRNAHIGAPFDQYCQEYGPIVNVRILFEDQVFTTEPEHIKAVLVTQFNSFEKGPVLADQGRSSTWIWSIHLRRGYMEVPSLHDTTILLQGSHNHFDLFEKHIEDALKPRKSEDSRRVTR
ncbi:hypothetical protein EDD15DRAFT_1298229 [Pisolithus albus]|nr:hypothetical protein EDD15DRAFT_1298229 [Pisolithus albus]